MTNDNHKLALSALVVFAASECLIAQTTPNLGLTVPFYGTPQWDKPVNGNFELIDTWSNTVCSNRRCILTGPLTAFSLTSNTIIQVNTTCPAGSPTGSICDKGEVIVPQPIASFTAASSLNKGRIQIASDGLSSIDCTVGGGSSNVVCVNLNGSSYTPIASGIGVSGPAFAVNFANSLATNFQADSTITINPTTHTFTAPNVTLSTLPSGNCVQTTTGGLLTTTGAPCASGVASIANGANGVVPLFTGAAAIAAQSHLDDGVTTASTITAQEAFSTKISPAADIRAFGAVIDGTTDISTALSAAVAQACTTSDVVLLPCTGSGCYYSGGSLPTCSQNVQYKIQGTIKLGSTLVQGYGQPLICDGGPQNNTAIGPTCAITASPAHGMLGTAVTSTGSATVTPTFLGTCHGIPCSASNLPVGSGITTIGTVTCTITSIVGTVYTGLGVDVVATVSTPCRIPQGALATVAGVTDTSFNGSPIILDNDYANGIISWQQTGRTVATSSGGTITGINDDTFESVLVTANSGGNITLCCFNHLHSASDVWGEVGVALATSTFSSHDINGVSINGAYGAGLLTQGSYGIYLNGVDIGSQAWASSIAVDFASASLFHITHSHLITASQFQCAWNCTQPSYPRAVRLTASGNQSFSDSTAIGIIDGNTWIQGGIKVDVNGPNSNNSKNKMGDIRLSDVLIEQPVGSVLQIDPRYVNTNRGFTLNNVWMQDYFIPYNNCYVTYTDQATQGMVNITTLAATDLTGCVTNKYYGAPLTINGIDFTQGTVGLPTYVGKGFTMNDGYQTETELRGEGSGFGPSIIPYATRAVVTNPASWACFTPANCIINTGILAPDGTNTAGEIVTAVQGGSFTQIFSMTTATSTGDMILSGVWCMPGTMLNENGCGSSNYSVYSITGGTGDSFDNTPNTNTNGQGGYANDWWTPVVTLNVITGPGNATPHFLSMALGSAYYVGNSKKYWQPFFLYIPISAKPASWTSQQWVAEAARWRQQLMHGPVPPSWNHPGVAVTTEPIAVPSVIPVTVYSAAGTALPSCTSSLNGTTATVSDATAPTYRASYASGGTVTTLVQCDGASTTWLTH